LLNRLQSTRSDIKQFYWVILQTTTFLIPELNAHRIRNLNVVVIGIRTQDDEVDVFICGFDLVGRY